MSFFEIVLTILMLIIENINKVMPIHLIDLIIFATGALFIEYLFHIFFYLIWNYFLKDLNSDLVEKDLYKKFTKKICFDTAEQNYFEENNNFKFELFYFIFTTLIFTFALMLKNSYMLLMFFAIKTSRNLIVASKIHLDGISLVKHNNFDEKEIYRMIFIHEDYDFSTFFKSREPGLCEELSILELKFNELIKRNKIDKDLAFNLMNSKRITSNIKDIINIKYSEIIDYK